MKLLTHAEVCEAMRRRVEAERYNANERWHEDPCDARDECYKQMDGLLDHFQSLLARVEVDHDE